MNCPLCHRKCEINGAHLRCAPLSDKAHYFYYGYQGDAQINNAREVIIIMPYRLTNYVADSMLSKYTYIDKWEDTEYHSTFKDLLQIPRISFEHTTEEKILNKIKTYLVFS